MSGCGQSVEVNGRLDGKNSCVSERGRLVTVCY